MQQCILSIRETLQEILGSDPGISRQGRLPALLMCAGTIEEWNAKMVETLISSALR